MEKHTRAFVKSTLCPKLLHLNNGSPTWHVCHVLYLFRTTCHDNLGDAEFRTAIYQFITETLAEVKAPKGKRYHTSQLEPLLDLDVTDWMRKRLSEIKANLSPFKYQTSR